MIVKQLKKNLNLVLISRKKVLITLLRITCMNQENCSLNILHVMMQVFYQGLGVLVLLPHTVQRILLTQNSSLTVRFLVKLQVEGFLFNFSYIFKI